MATGCGNRDLSGAVGGIARNGLWRSRSRARMAGNILKRELGPRGPKMYTVKWSNIGEVSNLQQGF